MAAISKVGRIKPGFGLVVVCVRQNLTNRPKFTNFSFDSGGFVNFSKAERPVHKFSLVFSEPPPEGGTGFSN